MTNPNAELIERLNIALNKADLALADLDKIRAKAPPKSVAPALLNIYNELKELKLCSDKSIAALEAQSGWCFDMEKAPKDDKNHFRGIWVQNNRTGSKWWEQYFGYVNEEGEFIISGIDEPAGWNPEDFDAFILFNPQPPTEEAG